MLFLATFALLPALAVDEAGFVTLLCLEPALAGLRAVDADISGLGVQLAEVWASGAIAGLLRGRGICVDCGRAGLVGNSVASRVKSVV